MLLMEESSTQDEVTNSRSYLIGNIIFHLLLFQKNALFSLGYDQTKALLLNIAHTIE